ncbi:MAG: Gfo/Idh/MocA family oxidoreductase, partial [Mariniphaga sp.]|nr:Gfo/Idh/MocA family oxidoreductase [Mariniphaga sp.]
MTKNVNARRDFIKKSAGISAALIAGGVLPGFSAAAYKRILGANDRLQVSMMGVNSRGNALAQNFAFQENCEVIHICDVDSRATEKCQSDVQKIQQTKPTGYSDFRKSLESKDVDILVIAAPDHWHAPAALLAMQANKHVYLEKPCSHNPREGEILIEAAKRYKKSVQMGNQRRSYPNVVQGINELKNGIIGKPYFGKGWYTNNRGPIGIGKPAPAPD